jgi:toxin ParE1/3/4
MKLELTDAAVEDLRAIADYTRHPWGLEQEESYLDGIWLRFEEMLEKPTAYRPREDLFPGCRGASVGSHVVLFRVEGNLLQVVRVLHGSMDLPRHVKADPPQRPRKQKR